MKSTVCIIVVLVTVLHLAHCQNIRSLTACLSDQSLRVDCYYDKKTSNPLSYEFRLSKDNKESRTVASNQKMSDVPFKNRANVTVSNDLVCLSLSGFTRADEGIYICQLRITNDYTDRQMQNVTVIKDRLEKCAGMSLLLQNTSWLFLLLLSLPLLQAVDFVSL